MSTKFNRNDAQAGNDYLYHDDYKIDLNGVEQDLLDALKTFEILPCIISGLTLTPAAYPSTNIIVAVGASREKEGKPVVVGSQQTVIMTNLSGGNNYVILNHKYSTDTARKAYTSGISYNTRKYDDFELEVAETYETGDIVLGNVKREGSSNVLYANERTPQVAKPFAIVPPPVPTRLTLTSGWDDVYRKTGAASGLISLRPAYIKAEFGDKGAGSASGNTFTWTQNRVGNWTTNEWAGQYLTCADGNSWRVVSNTASTLTLEEGAIPVSGIFNLGPDAAGYKFVITTLHPTTEDAVAVSEAEHQSQESPVKMECIWHNLTPDIKYSIKIASKGSWFQSDWSTFCTAVSIIAGGPKVIPDACADTLKNVSISAQDDGIRISWDIDPLYADHVAGVEIVHTDDGTDPDFDILAQKKIYTDRKATIIPARFSTNDATVIVKAKLRAIDKAGRHCVTPITITPTDAKKYPADLVILVNDVSDILSEGAFPSLYDLFSKSIELSTGRGRAIAEVESEMDDLRGHYPTAGARLGAILDAGVAWDNIRIVAKNNTGHFSSPQAAVNSINTQDFTLIILCPGDWDEVVDTKDKLVGFLGWGGPDKVCIGPNVGRLYSATEPANSGILLLANLKVQCTNQSYTEMVRLHNKSTASFPAYLQNVVLKIIEGTVSQALWLPAAKVFADLLRIRVDQTNCKGIFMAEQIDFHGNDVQIQSDKECIAMNYVVAGPSKCRLWNPLLKTANGTYTVTGQSAAQLKLWMAHGKYNKLPDETNITCDYGQIESGKVSNVKFDDADLEVPV